MKPLSPTQKQALIELGLATTPCSPADLGYNFLTFRALQRLGLLQRLPEARCTRLGQRRTQYQVTTNGYQFLGIAPPGAESKLSWVRAKGLHLRLGRYVGRTDPPSECPRLAGRETGTVIDCTRGGWTGYIPAELLALDGTPLEVPR